MEVTKYYCDACQREVSNRHSLILITFGIHFNREHVSSQETMRGHAKVCSECLKELGFESQVVTNQNKNDFLSKFKTGRNVFQLFKTLKGIILRRRKLDEYQEIIDSFRIK